MTKEEQLKQLDEEVPEGWFLVPDDGDQLYIGVKGWRTWNHSVGTPVRHHIVIRKEG